MQLYRNQVSYSRHEVCLDGALMENPHDCTTFLPSFAVTHLFVLAAVLGQCIGKAGSQEGEEERIDQANTKDVILLKSSVLLEQVF